ncbi:MAG: hypothetical protein LQ337_000634 [Flavoplaca oasis]|nr:MAG: hypothetical protein LQ337_000634 [Flavoplaca oasis]
MGTSDVITDLLLVTFPIPIVLKSHMAAKRKASLILLFSLSLLLIAITIYRVIEVVHRRSDQQFRSLLASLEILAAAAVSNALALGSFVRDRGVKKQRYRYGSVGGHSSLDRAATGERPRALTAQTWGSDADLAGELGMRMAPQLEQQLALPARPRLAPLALCSAPNLDGSSPSVAQLDDKLASTHRKDKIDNPDPSREAEKPPLGPQTIKAISPRRTSFFDVGGLLDPQELSPNSLSALERTTPEITPAPQPPDRGHGGGSSPSAKMVGQRRPKTEVSRSSRRSVDPIRIHQGQKSEFTPTFQDIGGLLN